jgi:PadR family transcriptional regulator AphA
MLARRRVTSTAYAVLGLLSLRSWTTYALSRQIRRSLHHFWPRAESNLYGAAEALSQHELAVARTDYHGRRPHTVYTITADGKRALQRWLSEPGAGPVLEFEALVKVFYADQGTRADLLTQLEAVRTSADASERFGAALARGYLEGGGPYPERLAVISLVNRFFWDYGQSIRTWVEWAQAEVNRWPELPSGWPNNIATLRDALSPYMDRIYTETP